MVERNFNSCVRLQWFRSNRILRNSVSRVETSFNEFLRNVRKRFINLISEKTRKKNMADFRYWMPAVAKITNLAWHIHDTRANSPKWEHFIPIFFYRHSEIIYRNVCYIRASTNCAHRRKFILILSPHIFPTGCRSKRIMKPNWNSLEILLGASAEKYIKVADNRNLYSHIYVSQVTVRTTNEFFVAFHLHFIRRVSMYLAKAGRGFFISLFASSSICQHTLPLSHFVRVRIARASIIKSNEEPKWKKKITPLYSNAFRMLRSSSPTCLDINSAMCALFSAFAVVCSSVAFFVGFFSVVFFRVTGFPRNTK